MKRHKSQLALTYPRLFKIAVKTEELKGALSGALDSQREKIENKIRRFEELITPHKKQKAIDDRRMIVSECRRRITGHGPPPNITKLVSDLRDAGISSRVRNEKDQPISDATIRKIIRDVIGIKGRPGRKPNP